MKTECDRPKVSKSIRRNAGGRALFFAVAFFAFSPVAAEGWNGVDESVVEKYAKEHGRGARKPYINTDRGDLLLFVFLLAGAVGGFIAGYSWKKLLDGKSPGNTVSNATTDSTLPKGKR